MISPTAFLGYSGGRQYDEFYAKTKYNDELGLTGFYQDQMAQENGKINYYH